MSPFARILRLPAALALLATLIVPAFSQDFTADTKKEVLDSMTSVVTKSAFVPGVDFQKWPEFLEKHRADIDKTTDSASFIREVNKTLREFGVSHIRLQSPRAAVTRTQVSTIGLGLSTRADEDGLTVTGVAPESPAAEAGLEVGDMILAVNSSPAKDPSALEGEEGKSITLKVKKKKGGDAQELTLQFRKYARIRPATLAWVGSDAAVLRIPTFSTGYSRENVESLLTEAAKAKTLVLDLRSNGGGAVNNLQHLLNLLIPAGTDYGTYVRRRTLDDYLKENADKPSDLLTIAKWSPTHARTRQLKMAPFTGKIAVLINRGSASASEITAAALRDVRGAKLVGTKSRGAVLASVFGKLADGYELQYPVSDYVTIKGVRLEGTPLVPDVEGPKMEPGSDTDAWVEAAIKACGN